MRVSVFNGRSERLRDKVELDGSAQAERAAFAMACEDPPELSIEPTSVTSERLEDEPGNQAACDTPMVVRMRTAPGSPFHIGCPSRRIGLLMIR